MRPTDLPIFEIRKSLLDHLTRQNRIIIQAPTGSGKSTQIPQILLDDRIAGNGQIVILQPRRLAARMLAARVAQERSVRLGKEVGYQIRFDDVSEPQTRIKFVTEGILLRRMLKDPSLSGISAILFDEFHERHLYGDITLARSMQIQETVRPDLKLGIMSATLSPEAIQKFFQPCGVLSAQGRTFPVEIEYLSKPADVERMGIGEIACQELERIIHSHPEGDVLIFMPGAHEIHRTIQSIRASRVCKGFIVLPLHGELSPSDQDAAVARYDQRKIIVSTNVAETSLTIDGVRLVIDSGLARIAKYDSYRGINTLLIEKISRASADQRSGRAGRTAPGHCLRLWTEREQETRPIQEIPEVKRLDLSEVILNLKASGVEDIRAFRWLEKPEPRSLDRAEMLLKDLGALETKTGSITELGRRMLSFPVHPRYSRMLIEAHQLRCVRPIALIAALTQGRNLWLRSEGRRMDEERKDLFGEGAESDFFVLMRACRYAEKSGYDVQRCRRVGIHATAARQVKPLFEYFLKIAEGEGLEVREAPVGNDAVQRCLLVGFSDHLAKRVDAGTLRCVLVHGRTGTLARDSVVEKSPIIVAGEVREVQQGKDQELNVILSLATAVKVEWLHQLFPGDFSHRREVAFDPVAKKVFVQEQTLFRDLILSSKRTEGAPEEAAANLLAQEVIKGNLVLKNWNDEIEQWIHRVNRLHEWCPEWNLPHIGTDERSQIIQNVCKGAFAYKEIKERPVWTAVRSRLTHSQQELVQKHTPERMTLPSGRQAKITYSAEGPPVLSATIQDLYGVHGSLHIAQNRTTLLIHVLAPNRRPLQITQNLSTFWKDDYEKIKKELQRKYPKHVWR